MAASGLLAVAKARAFVRSASERIQSSSRKRANSEGGGARPRAILRTRKVIGQCACA